MIDPYARAKALVGTKFRLHGREPRFGLDCIGLALIAFDVPDLAIPPYRLDEGTWMSIEAALDGKFVMRLGEARRSDLLVARRPRCFHFAVSGSGSFIHADLRFRRVVETPGAPQGGELRCYRSKKG